MERFSHDSAHLKHSNYCPISSNSETLEFPSTFIKLLYACEDWGGGGGGGCILSM